MRPSSSSFAALVACVFAFELFAVPARGDDDTPDAHLQLGLALRREHKNEEALNEFRRAFALAPTPRARAQIGFAEQALARWVDADRDLHAALEARDDAWVSKNLEPIESALATIDERLGWLTMICDAAHYHVALDGVPLEAGCAGRVRVVAGSHVIQVTSDRGPPLERHVDVAPRAEPRVVLVSPESEAAAPPSDAIARPSPAAHVPSSTQRTIGYAAGVAGIVGIATGLVLGAVALQERVTVQDHCPDKRCDATGLAAGQVGASLASWSTIAFVAGGISLGAAVTLVLTSPSPRAVPSGVAIRIAWP